MFRRFISFRTRHQPYMVRRNYRYELRSALTFPLAASLAEGSFTGVVAAKYFEAPAILIAVITAAPMFGNIMALVWSELAKTRRKVPFVNLLQLGVILIIASVALTWPMPKHIGGWVFAAQIILARMLASGIITIRSVIWRANYPRHTRGQIIGRISIVATAVLALSTFAGSYWLDKDPTKYIYLYPAAAILGAIGIYQFSRIRVRRENQSLRRLRQPVYTPRPEDMSHTDEANVLNYAGDQPGGWRAFFHESFQVLREDKEFRLYQRWQLISGFSFMMVAPALLYLVSQKLTRPDTQYLRATVVLQIVPMVISLLATQAWAPLFDRVHVTVFRVSQHSVSVAAQVIMFLGAALASHDAQTALAIIVVSQVLMGISNGGGNLAWNLGHNDFAPPEKAAIYMGVHVMLTGLRGCIAPFVGAIIYQSRLGGSAVFLIAAIMCIWALFGFMAMARRAPKKVHRVESM